MLPTHLCTFHCDSLQKSKIGKVLLPGFNKTAHFHLQSLDRLVLTLFFSEVTPVLGISNKVPYSQLQLVSHFKFHFFWSITFISHQKHYPAVNVNILHVWKCWRCRTFSSTYSCFSGTQVLKNPLWRTDAIGGINKSHQEGWD